MSACSFTEGTKYPLTSLSDCRRLCEGCTHFSMDILTSTCIIHEECAPTPAFGNYHSYTPEERADGSCRLDPCSLYKAAATFGQYSRFHSCSEAECACKSVNAYILASLPPGPSLCARHPSEFDSLLLPLRDKESCRRGCAWLLDEEDVEVGEGSGCRLSGEKCLFGPEGGVEEGFLVCAREGREFHGGESPYESSPLGGVRLVQRSWSECGSLTEDECWSACTQINRRQRESVGLPFAEISIFEPGEGSCALVHTSLDAPECSMRREGQYMCGSGRRRLSGSGWTGDTRCDRLWRDLGGLESFGEGIPLGVCGVARSGAPFGEALWFTYWGYHV